MSKHIFISYSRGNLEVVQRVTTDLLNAGINVWIDQVGLKPGTSDWEQALRDAIHNAEAVLFMASPTARRSPYVRDELAIADMEQVQVYPVWIEGDHWMDCVPMGRGYVQFIDVRDKVYSAGIQQIIAALSGSAVQFETQEAAVAAEPTTSVDRSQPPRNPYKGLRPFREEDEQDFFGRDALIEELIETLGNGIKPPRLLAILGASGSGKSSVVMAGLLPRLKTGAIEGSEHWVYLDPLVPGVYPLESLTIALARLMKEKSQKAIREDLLDRSKRGLYTLTRELSDKPVVLYIDQFEELFTLVNDEAERRQFIDLLTTAISEPNGVLLVILSMRADLYDRPMQYTGFGKLIEAHHVAVTPMGLADLYDVVQKPAQLAGLTFDEGLVTEMVFAVREEVGALPLLQFTLDQLFEKRDGRTLTLQAYTEMGGVQGALAQHAEATYNNLPSKQHKTLARAVFLRLIEAGATEQDTTRRRASTSELTLSDIENTRILQETANTFIDARLLVSNKIGEEHTIEVSHEALIREWKRLGEWLHEAREDLRLQKSLSADVVEWKRRGQPVDMLYRGTVLREAQAWVARATASADELSFVNASEQEQVRQTALEQERVQREQTLQRRATTNLRILIGLVVTAALIGGSFLILQLLSNVNKATQITQAYEQAASYMANAQYGEAVAEYSRILLLEPTDDEASLARAVAHAAQGDYDAAINDYTLLLSSQGVSHASVYNDRGVMYAAIGDFENAYADYDQAIASDPDLAVAYHNRGVLLTAQRKFEEAIVDLERATQLAPEVARYMADYQLVTEFVVGTSPSRLYRAVTDVEAYSAILRPDEGMPPSQLTLLRKGEFVTIYPGHVEIGDQVWIAHNFGWSIERSRDATQIYLEAMAFDLATIRSLSMTSFTEESFGTPEQRGNECRVVAQVAGGANFRAEPTTTGQLLVRLAYGATVPVIELVHDNDNFMWVNSELRDGTRGWIREDLVGFIGNCDRFGIYPHYRAPLENGNWVRGFDPDGNTAGFISLGWDVGGRIGEPVYTSGVGIVSEVLVCSRCEGGGSAQEQGLSLSDESILRDPEWVFGFGNTVVIRYLSVWLPSEARQQLEGVYGEGVDVFCRYAHLETILVEQGQVLSDRAQIGTLGNSGNSSGPHLGLDCAASAQDELSFKDINLHLFDPSILFSRQMVPEWLIRQVGYTSSAEQLSASENTSLTATAYWRSNIPTTIPTPIMAQLGEYEGHIDIGGKQLWNYVGHAGETLNINVYAANPAGTNTESFERVQSHLLDTYILLYAPDGTALAENDHTYYEDGSTNSDSVIMYTLPESGVYTIEVRSYNFESGGSYTLIIGNDRDELPEQGGNNSPDG